MTLEPTPPLLRWAGSKKRQYNKLKPLFPSRFNNYIEPFAGSAAFLFSMRPERAKLNDININLFDFYHYAKTDPTTLYNRYRRIQRTADSYYRTRDKFNSSERGIAKSAYFYFLNRNCFNGIFRVNKAGDFNVPYSDSRVSPYLTREQYLESCSALNATDIYNSDFEEFCDSMVGQDDFVFLDPPYYRTGRRTFNEYSLQPFTPSDFARLSTLLGRMNERGAKFLLSFPRTADSIELAKSWPSKTAYVLRTVASNPNARRKQSELLIYNYDAQLT